MKKQRLLVDIKAQCLVRLKRYFKRCTPAFSFVYTLVQFPTTTYFKLMIASVLRKVCVLGHSQAFVRSPTCRDISTQTPSNSCTLLHHNRQINLAQRRSGHYAHIVNDPAAIRNITVNGQAETQAQRAGVGA